MKMISAKELRKISDKANQEKNPKLKEEWLANLEQDLLCAAQIGATQYAVFASSDDKVLSNESLRNDVMRVLYTNFGYNVAFEPSQNDAINGRLIIDWSSYTPVCSEAKKLD